MDHREFRLSLNEFSAMQPTGEVLQLHNSTRGKFRFWPSTRYKAALFSASSSRKNKTLRSQTASLSRSAVIPPTASPDWRLLISSNYAEYLLVMSDIRPSQRFALVFFFLSDGGSELSLTFFKLSGKYFRKKKNLNVNAE